MHLWVIKEANRDNKRIVLMPGPHLTKPAHNQKIQINKNGLTITGTLSPGEFSSIKRPNNAIDLLHSDGNYGLFLVPAVQPMQNGHPSLIGIPILQPILKRELFPHLNMPLSSVVQSKLRTLELDCNMGMQGLPAVYPFWKDWTFCHAGIFRGKV